MFWLLIYSKKHISPAYLYFQCVIIVFNVHFLLLYNRETLFRLTITASCPMDLQYFPMDSQLCYIEIESCKYRHGRAFSSEYSLVFIHKMFFKKWPTKSSLNCHLTNWPNFPSLLTISYQSSLVILPHCSYSLLQSATPWRTSGTSGMTASTVSRCRGTSASRSSRSSDTDRKLSRPVYPQVGILCDWDIFTCSHLNLWVSLTE